MMYMNSAIYINLIDALSLGASKRFAKQLISKQFTSAEHALRQACLPCLKFNVRIMLLFCVCVCVCVWVY